MGYRPATVYRPPPPSITEPLSRVVTVGSTLTGVTAWTIVTSPPVETTAPVLSVSVVLLWVLWVLWPSTPSTPSTTAEAHLIRCGRGARVIPVESVVTGEVLAGICASCGEQTEPPRTPPRPPPGSGAVTVKRAAPVPGGWSQPVRRPVTADPMDVALSQAVTAAARPRSMCGCVTREAVLSSWASADQWCAQCGGVISP